jgi:membrane protease YdiL (CAAX protease family)
MPQRYTRAVLLILITLVGAIAVSGGQLLFVWMPPIAGLVYEVMITLIALVLWYRWQHAAWTAALPRAARSSQVVATAALCCSALAAAHGWWIPPADLPTIGVATTTVWGRASLIVAGIFTAPLLEEALMRGFLLGKLQRSFTTTTSVLLSGATFAVAHGDVTRLVPQLAGGIVLGAIVVSTGRLWLAVAAHGALNLSGLLEAEAYHLTLPERLGILFPVLCIVIASIAALELRRVLTMTRWRVPPNPASLVAAPVTWGLDISA